MKKHLLASILFTVSLLSIVYAQGVASIDAVYGAVLDEFNTDVYKIVKQPDGKILIGGAFTQYGSLTRNRLIRLNADGTVDNTFNIGTGFNDWVHAIAVQTDGKILVGGDFTTFNGATVGRFVRLNADGSRDNTYGTGTGFNAAVRDVAIQPDGKALYVGDFTTFNGVTTTRIARLETDGTKDTGFIYQAGGRVWCVAYLSTGIIAFGGEFNTFGQGVTTAAGVSKYAIVLTNGAIAGAAQDGTVRVIKELSNGEISIGGQFTGGLKRFTTGGPVTISVGTQVLSINEDSNGNLYVTGSLTKQMRKILPNNTVDNTFTDAITTGFNNYVASSVLLNDSVLLCGGTFFQYNGIGVGFVAPIRLISNCQPTSGSYAVTECESYTAPNGNFYSSTGTYNYTLQNTGGCDSTVVLNLTILQPKETYISTEACDVYTTGSGNQYTFPGSYQEDLTAANGCDSTVFYQIFMVHQTSETITSEGDSLISDMGSAQDYQWYNCATNQPIDGATDRVFYPSAPGNYKVIASVSLCTVESECVSFGDTGTSISSLNAGNLQVYPNPVKDILHVTADNAVSIEIYDIRGAKVLSVSENTVHAVSVSSLSSGMYLLKAGRADL
jgi:uncharacterized delta-60 repeat protein